ncbi:pilus assembly protein PilO [Nostoc sp. 106C]|uniref:pilus assembly protein PilO n=1 Tax=Nostoc sp. 106C TaxID=1932667 RepID=UPI000A38D0CA|nr:pilus assembly protein PilO [Nostoc sp. 106C]OUL32448.1 pilus assembly protein PilO [Nostoc sp. 106C]
MTLSEDLNFAEHNGEFGQESPAYPVVFGISFTPKIIGILAGVLGLAGTLYIVLNLLMPAWDTYQQKQAKISELQGQVDQKKASIKKIDQVKAELDQAKLQQAQVLTLFSNEKTLDTLLLDLNRLIETGNVKVAVPGNLVTAKLKKFVPDVQQAQPITDGSLGKQVDGKLKRSNIDIQIVGTYEQTQSIIRNIERLQPLLIFTDYQSTLAPPELNSTSEKGVQTRGPASINTTFKLQALMPLSPEEIAAATAKAAPKK